MGQGRIDNRYTPECIEWCVTAYKQGMICSEIARAAQIEFPDLFGSFNRNCVLGIVHRAGAMKERMGGAKHNLRNAHGGHQAVITLPGPKWAVEMIGKPYVRSAA